MSAKFQYALDAIHNANYVHTFRPFYRMFACQCVGGVQIRKGVYSCQFKPFMWSIEQHRINGIYIVPINFKVFEFFFQLICASVEILKP